MTTFNITLNDNPLILQIDAEGYLIGAYSEEGGSYPLLDFEYEEIYYNWAIEKKGRNYRNLYKRLEEYPDIAKCFKPSHL